MDADEGFAFARNAGGDGEALLGYPRIDELQIGAQGPNLAVEALQFNENAKSSLLNGDILWDGVTHYYKYTLIFAITYEMFLMCLKFFDNR